MRAAEPSPDAALSPIVGGAPELLAQAKLTVHTPGRSFTEITRHAAQFIETAGAHDGILLLFIRHTSASLVIQENADADVRRDLITALDRLAPENAHWVHDVEGPDDMPAHVKTMLSGVCLHVPVSNGALALGTWQGIYVAEHRARPHRREIVLQFIGARRRRGPQQT
jgi:secondary thiamine-phosphate synthase enzyme